DNNGYASDVFRWSSGALSLVSAAAGSRTAGANGTSSDPVVSADGSTVVFLSTAFNLVNGFVDENDGGRDVYRWRKRSVSLVSHAAGAPTQGADTDAGFDQRNLSVSRDGSVVAFASGAGNLISGFISPGRGLQIYLWESGQVVLASGAGGSATQGGYS